MSDFLEPQEEEVSGAKDYALALLARRPYPRKELEQKLRRRGFSEAAIGVAVTFLVEYHYLNDAEFAAFWVSSRSRKRSSGRRRLEQELVSRGIDPQEARDAIRRELPPEDELRAAIELLMTRCRRPTRPGSPSLPGSESQPGAPDGPHPNKKRRLADFLLRRGYNHETVQKALRHVLGDDDGDSMG